MQAIVLETQYFRRWFEPGHVSLTENTRFGNFQNAGVIWSFLKIFVIKQLAENVLPVCMCLTGLFGFKKVKRYFIFSHTFMVNRPLGLSLFLYVWSRFEHKSPYLSGLSFWVTLLHGFQQWFDCGLLDPEFVWVFRSLKYFHLCGWKDITSNLISDVFLVQSINVRPLCVKVVLKS